MGDPEISGGGARAHGKCIEPGILDGGAIAPVKIYNSNSTALVTGLSSNIFGCLEGNKEASMQLTSPKQSKPSCCFFEILLNLSPAFSFPTLSWSGHQSLQQPVAIKFKSGNFEERNGQPGQETSYVCRHHPTSPRSGGLGSALTQPNGPRRSRSVQIKNRRTPTST